MATSIPEQIAVLIKARLEKITTANGYDLEVDQVVRPKRLPDFQPRDKTIVMLQGDRIQNPALSHPASTPATAWVIPWSLHLIRRPSETDTTSADTLRNQFDAEVLKALGVATTGYWAQWDGLAINSSLGASTEGGIEGIDAALTAILTVTLRTDETNLYTVRA